MGSVIQHAIELNIKFFAFFESSVYSTKCKIDLLKNEINRIEVGSVTS
jgi:hypothetical protein